MPARDYEKQGQIGEGTFGTVSKAVHRPSGSVVAIKKIRCRTPKQGTEVPTLREIMLLQELQHENVIELIEVFCKKANNRRYVYGARLNFGPLPGTLWLRDAGVKFSD